MKKTFTFKSNDGITDIYCVKWGVKNPRAVLQVSHGMGEFIDRYEDLAKYLNKEGIVVVGNDSIGHGNSISDKKAPLYFGEEGSWKKYAVEDLVMLYKMTKEEYPDIPYFVLGLSLGGYLMRGFLINYPDFVDGAVIIGTSRVIPFVFKFGLFYSNLQRKKYGDDALSDRLYNIVYGTHNNKFKPNRTEIDWLCANEEALDEYIADKRRGEGVTIGLFRELLSAMLYSRDMNNIKRMNKKTPIFFLSGKDDAVSQFSKGVMSAYKDFKKAGIKDVEYKIYPDMRHDILHEKNKEEVFNDIYKWLDKKMKKNKKNK